MALYFETSEKEVIRMLVESVPMEPWVRKAILGKFDADEARIEKIKNCEHTYGKYVGHKECCTKCESFGVGMGTSWSLVRGEEAVKSTSEDSMLSNNKERIE